MTDTAVRATASLAEFLASTRSSDLPRDVMARAKLILADTAGVAIRGSTEPQMRRLAARCTQVGESTLLCRGFPKADPRTAAAANATAICFEELDEGSRPTGHPALHIVPSALAFAQATGKSGMDLLTAICLGYEAQARLSWATKLFGHVHPHGNLGNVGAVVAVGRLAGWNGEQMCQGMTMAAGLTTATSWQPCLVGATVRNAYPAVTALVALWVRELVESGFAGYENALEDTFGHILGSDFEPDVLTEALGQRYLLRENYFKFHAACALTHPALDALADAMGVRPQNGVYPPLAAGDRPAPASVRRVELRMAAQALRLAVSARPNPLSAKFSIPYTAAAYLVHGKTDPSIFTDEVLADKDVLAVQNKVTVISDPQITARWPEEAAATATVELTDGRVLEGACRNPFGSKGNPAGEAELKAKFDRLTGQELSERERETVWGWISGIQGVANVSLFPLAG